MCAEAAGSSRRMCRASYKVLKDKAVWLQEYITTGRLGEAFGENLRRELPTTNPKEIDGFLKVSYSYAIFCRTHDRPWDQIVALRTMNSGDRSRFQSTYHNAGYVSAWFPDLFHDSFCD